MTNLYKGTANVYLVHKGTPGGSHERTFLIPIVMSVLIKKKPIDYWSGYGFEIFTEHLKCLNRKRGRAPAQLRARGPNGSTETQQGSVGLGEEATEDHLEGGSDQLPVWQNAASEGLPSHA